LMSRINGALPAGKRVGYLTPLLYHTAGATTIGAQGCRDITTGNNITAAVGGYVAGTGYDAVTGWDVPEGNKLLNLLKPVV